MKIIDKIQIKKIFRKDGCYFPIDAMTTDECIDYCRKYESIRYLVEQSNIGRKGQLSHMHAVLRFVNEIVRNE